MMKSPLLSRIVLRVAQRRILIILAVALGVRIVYAILIADTGCLAINADPMSDMETFHRWALRIVGGDWLGRNDFHPYHFWQEGIAPDRTWLSWYSPHVFHQDPAYPYFVAFIYLFAPRHPISIIVVQHLLGLLTAAGIYLLARRLVSERGAFAAGLLAAVYGPFLFYESLLLRDTLLIPLNTAFLLCVEEARRRGGWRWWGASGLVAGVIYLTKPNILVFLPLLALWILLGGEERRRGAAIGMLAAGFVLAVTPVAARNVAVGAPPLETTTRGAIEFINGNSPYHPGIGWFDGEDERVTSYARGILVRTRGRLLPTVEAVLGTWRGRLGEFAVLQVKKLGYLLAPYEMPNNESYAYFRMNSPILRWGAPSFYVISPLAALGLLATARAWRRLLPHYMFLIAGGAATVAFYVIARFRIPYIPLVLVFAGEGAAFLVGRAADRRWGSLLACAAFVACLLALNSAVNYPDLDQVRPLDYIVAAEAYASRGQIDSAVAEVDRGRQIFPEFAPIHTEAGKLHERAGDRGGALAAYRMAVALEPGSPEAREGIRRLQAPPP